MFEGALPATAHIVMAVLAVVAGLLVGVPLVHWWTSSTRRREIERRRRRMLVWEAAADERGLRVAGPDEARIVGEIEGIEVEAGESHVTLDHWFFTGVGARVPGGLLEGSRVTILARRADEVLPPREMA